MAYSSTLNHPAQISSRGRSTESALWSYHSTHGATEILVAGFFTDAQALGMRVGDVVMSIQATTGSSYSITLAPITAVSSTGGTVASGALTST